MSVSEIEESDLVTSASLEEKAKLKRHFSRFDIYFFLICTIVGVDTLAQVATNGAQGFLWLIFLCIFFFVPYGLLVAELGASVPEEGGAYVWTRMAWGRLTAALNSVFYWFSNPVWIGATLSLLAVAAIQKYFFSFEDNSAWYYIIGLGYIWFSVWSAILSFGVGKWIPTIGAWCRIALVALFSVSTIIYAGKYGLNFPAASDWTPTWAAFIALVPLIFYNLVGFDVPSAAGDEMTNPQKDVPVSVLRAMVTSILLYGLPILAIICIIPPKDLEGVSGLLDAVDKVFQVWGSAEGFMIKIAVIMFILAVISSASSWLMGADRAQAIAAVDGAGPRWLGRFSANFGTPVNVNLVSGILSTMVFLAASTMTSGDAANAFNVTIGIVLLFTTLSYIVIFPSVIKLRKSHPHINRPYKIPGGMAGVWVCGLITTFWAVFASLVGIFPGLGDGQFLNDADLPDGVTRGGYTAMALGSIAVTLAVGLIFYWLGTPTRQNLVVDPEAPVDEIVV
jgi:hypothetical protein